MAFKSIPLYFLRHWRGELSLATSFWINIVALNLLVLGFIDPFLNPAPVINLTFDLSPSIDMLVSFAFYIIDPHGILTLEDPVSAARAYFIWAVFKLAILYPWQFVGLMRSCNRYVVERGKTFWASTAQLLAVIGFAGVVVNTNQLWPVYRDIYQWGFVAHRYTYQVELIKDGTIIHLKGDIGLGVSNDVSNLLMQHSGVKGIILNSDGGYADEAYELSHLVIQYGLDTYVLGACYSACTMVFTSGDKRFLGRESFLGFHQTGLPWSVGQDDQEYLEYYQRRYKKWDLMIFEWKGIKHEFLEKIHDTPHDDMWVPEWSELFDSGIFHGVVKSDLTPIYGIVPRFGVVVEKGESWHVTKVKENSVAEKSQLQKGDVLLQWNDVKLDSYLDLIDQIEKMDFGGPFRIKIRRNNSVLELEGVLQ